VGNTSNDYNVRPVVVSPITTIRRQRLLALLLEAAVGVERLTLAGAAVER
jgi:hypothetical protein